MLPLCREPQFTFRIAEDRVLTGLQDRQTLEAAIEEARAASKSR